MNNEFRYNMRSEINSLNRIAARYFYPAVGAMVLVCGFYLLFVCFVRSSPSSVIVVDALFSGACFLLAVFLFYLSRIVYRFEARKFRVLTDGIEIQGFAHCWYPWDDLWGVEVMHFAAVASRDRSFTVICCFLEQPETGYQNRMLDYFYGVTHSEGIVIIEYCDEVMNEFKEKYPGTIVDHRATQKNEH